MSGKVRAHVWSTGSGGRRTWHYVVMRGDGLVVLYDNTGQWLPVIRAALCEVTALRHMEIAGHKLKGYRA